MITPAPHSCFTDTSRRLKSAALLLSLSLLGGCEYLKDAAIAERYVAKNICTGIFVSGYQQQKLINDYILPMMPPAAPYWKITVDHEAKSVHVADKIFGERFAADALYQPPLGCVLQFDRSAELLRNAVPPAHPSASLPAAEWPLGELTAAEQPGVDYPALERAVDEMFAETPDNKKQTTAVLVIYNEKLILQRYAPGVTADTAVKGYSASKGVLGAVVGAAYDQGLIELDSPAALPQWQGTAKAAITLRHLLHMQSGLQHQEIALGANNDQGQVLYGVTHPADLAASKPLIHEPGSRFNYSSGDSSLVSHLLQQAVGGRDALYRFYKQNLFEVAGMHRALFEQDTDGYINGAEGALLTPQEWARMAWLYVNEGRIGGRQVLSEEWVRLARTPSAAEPDYGFFIPLNTTLSQWPALPQDSFEFIGAMGQHIVGIPSRKTVIVRLGFTYDLNLVDVNQFGAAILQALPASSQ